MTENMELHLLIIIRLKLTVFHNKTSRIQSGKFARR